MYVHYSSISLLRACVHHIHSDSVWRSWQEVRSRATASLNSSIILLPVRGGRISARYGWRRLNLTQSSAAHLNLMYRPNAVPTAVSILSLYFGQLCCPKGEPIDVYFYSL